MTSLAIDARPWESVDPISVTADGLRDLMAAVVPADLSIGQFESWQNWWQNIPKKVIEQAMYSHPYEIFEAECANSSPVEALELFCAHAYIVCDLRDSLRRATDLSTSWMQSAEYYRDRYNDLMREHSKLEEELERLRERDQTMEAARQEILRLKAEIYDMAHERKEGV